MQVGSTIPLDLPELGAVGDALVVSVRAAPPIESGDGHVVTGRFIHTSDTPLINILIDGEDEPTGVTANHPYWSADREAFIPAGELRVGEHVDTLLGQRTIASITPRGPPEPVYNLEVHNHHVYRVGQTGVLVHNACGKDFSDELSKSGSVARRRLRSNLGLKSGNTDEAHHIIPFELRNHDLVKKASKAGFNINGKANGVPLSFARHRGINIFHHNRYNKAIRRRLDFEFTQRTDISNEEAAKFLDSYVAQIKKAFERTRSQLQ
ncbi:AHH domain-containing protein [Calycomorphotria hydatis]|uniref:AHH domain-containing protein n=1 Tax=Calycomorphotria hydatis TaxID=2528027 RepID=UPI001E5814A8|nr:AHH domain-containing protein [Calycomorphotria hydatis]